MKHRGRARGETRGHAGTGQVLEFRVGRNLGRKILNGDAGVQTVAVDLVEVSEARWVNQRLATE